MTSREQATGLFVGVCTLDVIQQVERVPAPDEKTIAEQVVVAAGGPATNAAVAFAALGGRAVLLTRFGHDPPGAIVEADLDAHGVEVVNVADPGVRTTVASILVTASSGERAVVSAVDQGRSAREPLADAELFSAIDPDVVTVDSHEVDLSLPVTRAAVGRGVPVVLDCGAKKPQTDRQLPYVSVAVVSEQYLEGAAQAAADDLGSHGVRFRAVTAGARPVRYWGPTREGEVAVPRVEAVDTTGAGDFFHGAFALRVAQQGLEEATFRGALEFSARTAARSVGTFGTRAWLAHLG